MSLAYLSKTVWQRLPLAHPWWQLPDAHACAIGPEFAHSNTYKHYGVACPDSVARAVDSRRAEYLAGRLAAVAALQEAGLSITDLGIGINRAPAWPSGIMGSITHTRSIAAAVIVPNGRVHGIGIDLENIVDAQSLSAIRDGVLAPGEEMALHALRRLYGEAVAATIGFSAKESFYKAAAATVGHVFDFDALRIVGVQPERQRLYAEVALPLAPTLGPGLQVCLGYSLLNELMAVLTSCVW